MKKIFVLLLLFLAVGSWSRCYTSTFSDYRYGTNSSCSVGNSCGNVGCPSVSSGKIDLGCISIVSRCSASGFSVYQYCSGSRTVCDDQADADRYNDSLACVNQGNNFNNGHCESPCDSTKYTCQTHVENSQTTIATDNITCINGTCFGGVYCEFLSKSITTCTNECGGTTEQVASVPIRYDGACNQDNLTDEDICTPEKCVTQNGFYHTYKLCASREIVQGEQKMFPRFTGGGVGNCASVGMKEDDGLNDSSADSSSVSKDCFVYGLGCPPKDSTNYDVPQNRNPEKCSCNKFDGMGNVSQIVCPDGSSSIFYGSCNDWKDGFSSSSESPSSSESVPPASSSSGSENPPTSAAGSTDWVTWSQGEEIKTILGNIAQNVSRASSPINTPNLDNWSTDDTESDVPFVRQDSVFDPVTIIDTAGILNAIFDKVNEKNEILDTLQHSDFTGCPCITFFSGNGKPSLENNRIVLPEIKIDLGNLNGYNLCRIIQPIVIAFASIVSFFIGFAIFKNVSQ